MNEKERREQIERALGPYLREGWYEVEPLNTYGYDMQKAYDALAEHAIIVEAEVEHILPDVDPMGCPGGYTIIDGIFNLPYGPQPYGEFRYEREGLHGKPGKAWVIIVSLEEEEKTKK